MSVTVVNDWRFKEDGNIEKGMKAAADLVDYFKANFPEVQLSLWLRDRGNPRRFFHITVFDSLEALSRVRESQGIQAFVEQLFPEIIHDHTYTSPACDVVLSGGGTLPPEALQLG